MIKHYLCKVFLQRNTTLAYCIFSLFVSIEMEENLSDSDFGQASTVKDSNSSLPGSYFGFDSNIDESSENGVESIRFR